MNRMDLNSTHSCDFSYHNITRSQISIDKYNGESKRINILEKISGQKVVEIAFSNNLIIEHWIFLGGNSANPADGKASVRYAETAYASLKSFA